MPIRSFKPIAEKGQGLVEYAIIIAVVAIVVVGAMTLLGPRVGNTFSTIDSSFASVGKGNNAPGEYPGLNSPSFVNDLAFYSDPANKCNADYYSYGSIPACDAIYDRVRACLDGGSGPYCVELQQFVDGAGGGSLADAVVACSSSENSTCVP